MKRSTAKLWMLATASGAVLIAQGAAAQDTPAAGQVQEVVVTASRVARTGFTAPTPTTVIGTAQIEARAATNITDTINETPAFRPSAGPAANQRGGGTSGGSYLDLRGLNNLNGVASATARTLVLVDGRRYVPATATGQVDLNMIPSGLVERTEVVTGGASAAWGSDAIAGVVNIILKDKLQGVQGNISYGQSDKDDNTEYAVSLAAGTSFSGGRGHVIAGFDYVDNKGVPEPKLSRDWGAKGYGIFQFAGPRPPGLPSRIFTSDNRIGDGATPGGIIIGGPLDNIEFTGGQGTRLFQVGSIYSSLLTPASGGMIGGGATSNAQIFGSDGSNLVNPIKRYSALMRASYDLTDKINAFVELSKAQSRYDGFTANQRNIGPGDVLTIQRDNAFLPDSIRAAMVANNLQTIAVGRINYDSNFGFYPTHTDQTTDRYVFGLKGDINGNWKWDGYYEYGSNHYKQKNPATIVSNYFAAVDAVRDPAGNIVCRSLITARGPADPGCVPFNIFGQNSPSNAAVNYVRGTGINDVHTKQQVAAANLTGDLFTLPAGPMSLAVGVEWRKEEVRSTTDATSQANRFDLNNFQPFVPSSYSTNEIYGELAVPLLKDVTLFKSLDVNGAARRTDYSTSGPVVTWKVGGSWEPIDSIRFRATKSRDSRSPNLGELYSPAVGGRTFINATLVTQSTVSNPNLVPEKSDTFTGGVVYQSNWLRGFKASADYYNINIKQAISSLAGQTVFDRCAAGAAEFCADITRLPNGAIGGVTVRQLNFASVKTSGWDLEFAYTVPDNFLVPGQFQLRALGSYVAEFAITDSAGTVDRVKQNVPKWAWTGNITYNLARFSSNAQFRYIAPMVRDVTLIGPDNPNYSPSLPNSINDNTIPAVWYLNLSASYDIIKEGGRRLQIYGVMNNVFDRSPPAGTGLFNNGFYVYDLIGRSFRVGMRFNY